MIIKIPPAFFCRNRQANMKLHMETQGTPKTKTILKKNWTGRLILPGVKAYYKDIVFKIVVLA